MTELQGPHRPNPRPRTDDGVWASSCRSKPTRRAGRAAFAVFACSISLLACQKPALSSDDRAAIEQVLLAQQHAWNAGDITTFMEGYHQRDDIIFTSGGAVRRGYQAALASYSERYVDGEKMGHLALSKLEITGLGSEAAVVLGEWALSETPVSGQGVFTLVFERAHGRWGIVHDHSSLRPQPGPKDAPEPPQPVLDGR